MTCRLFFRALDALGPQQAGDRRAATAAARSRAAGVAHLVDRTGTLTDGLANGSVTNSMAVADEQGSLPEEVSKILIVIIKIN
jgi:hypothetical protein